MTYDGDIDWTPCLAEITADRLTDPVREACCGVLYLARFAGGWLV